MKLGKSWRRLLMLMVALPLAAGTTAAASHPSGKTSGSPSAFTSVTLAQTSVSRSGCDLTLTYTWKGFHQVWRYGISIYQGAYPSTDWVATFGARSSGSGTATLKYTMQSGSAGTFYGKGTLWTQADNLIAGSYKTTPDLSFSCPAVVGAGASRR